MNLQPKRTVWDIYSNAWKLTSADEKLAALQESVAPDCVYTDPITIATGHQELLHYMLDFHKQVPGGHFPLTYFLDHHNVSIARWNLAAGDGTILSDGISYAQYNEAGKLLRMTGFFKPMT